jgi:hypothetical protein
MHDPHAEERASLLPDAGADSNAKPSLLSKEGTATLSRSRKILEETLRVGAQVTERLARDSDVIRGVHRRTDQLGDNEREAERVLQRLERRKTWQNVAPFVCLGVIVLVLGAFWVVLSRRH